MTKFLTTPHRSGSDRGSSQHGLSSAVGRGSISRQGYEIQKVERYLDRIEVPKTLLHQPRTLELLKLIVKHHHTSVTFDNVELHYSKHHTISLDADHLYRKIVENRRGGDCLENNTFLANVLRGLGFVLTTVGVRVNSSWKGGPDIGEYGPFTHMVLIVSIDGTRYSVDAHFGGNEPSQPLPLTLEDSTSFDPGKSAVKDDDNMRVIRDNINGNTDPTQKLWIYQYRDSRHHEWKAVYAFSEQEFFPADFATISYFLSTIRKSWYTYILMCSRTLLVDGEVSGSLRLVGRKIIQKVQGKDITLQICATENERIVALDKYFGIKLTEEEQSGISGLVTEIRSSPEL